MGGKTWLLRTRWAEGGWKGGFCEKSNTSTTYNRPQNIMNIIAKARRWIKKTGSVSGAAAKLGIPRSSLRRMIEQPATKRQKIAPIIAPIVKESLPVGQWMQSLHHESAHFITDGHAACESAQNGARVVAGMTWFLHDGCLRKCQRCMAHAT